MLNMHICVSVWGEDKRKANQKKNKSDTLVPSITSLCDPIVPVPINKNIWYLD